MENGKSGSGKDRAAQRPFRERAARKAEKTNDQILKAPAKAGAVFFCGKESGALFRHEFHDAVLRPG